VQREKVGHRYKFTVFAVDRITKCVETVKQVTVKRTEDDDRSLKHVPQLRKSLTKKQLKEKSAIAQAMHAHHMPARYGKKEKPVPLFKREFTQEELNALEIPGNVKARIARKQGLVFENAPYVRKEVKCDLCGGKYRVGNTKEHESTKKHKNAAAQYIELKEL